jgi:hypothetical protein
MKKKSTIPLKLLPIDNDGYHLQIKISINGKPANVLVDTGASRTVFDKKRIKKLVKNEKPEAHDKLSTGLGTNTMESHKIGLKKLKLGKTEIKDYSTILLDLTHVNQSYKQLKLKPIDGVIGSDLLHAYNAIIDYKRKILILTE